MTEDRLLCGWASHLPAKIESLDKSFDNRQFMGPATTSIVIAAQCLCFDSVNCSIRSTRHFDQTRMPIFQIIKPTKLKWWFYRFGNDIFIAKHMLWLVRMSVNGCRIVFVRFVFELWAHRWDRRWLEEGDIAIGEMQVGLKELDGFNGAFLCGLFDSYWHFSKWRRSHWNGIVKSGTRLVGGSHPGKSTLLTLNHTPR